MRRKADKRGITYRWVKFFCPACGKYWQDLCYPGEEETAAARGYRAKCGKCRKPQKPQPGLFDHMEGY